MSGHPVCRCRIKTVATKEALRCIGRPYFSVKKHRALIGIFPTKFNIMADHKDRPSLLLLCRQNPCKPSLKMRIKPFGRLIQQQKLRISQQHLAKCQSLFFPAGQIIWMHPFQSFKLHFPDHITHCLQLLFSGDRLITKRLIHLFLQRDFRKDGRRILWQYADTMIKKSGLSIALDPFSKNRNSAPPGLPSSTQYAKCRTFPGSISTHQRIDLSFFHSQ